MCHVHQQYTQLKHNNQSFPPCFIGEFISSSIQNYIQFFKRKKKEKNKTDFFDSVINCGKGMVFQPLNS